VLTNSSIKKKTLPLYSNIREILHKIFLIREVQLHFILLNISYIDIIHEFVKRKMDFKPSDGFFDLCINVPNNNENPFLYDILLKLYHSKLVMK